MSALDELQEKTFTPEKMTELDWFIWNNRNLRGEQAAAELSALRAELKAVTAERDAWKSIVLGLSPDGWLQSGMMEECIANCGNEPEQGHAADCQFAAALAEGDE